MSKERECKQEQLRRSESEDVREKQKNIRKNMPKKVITILKNYLNGKVSIQGKRKLLNIQGKASILNYSKAKLLTFIKRPQRRKILLEAIFTRQQLEDNSTVESIITAQCIELMNFGALYPELKVPKLQESTE